VYRSFDSLADFEREIAILRSAATSAEPINVATSAAPINVASSAEPINVVEGRAPTLNGHHPERAPTAPGRT
jgi:hypothetical protein